MRRSLTFLTVLASLSAGPAMAVDIHGHRGARGLLPENTLPAFREAIALGVDILELDTGMTADGVVVVLHDPGPVARPRPHRRQLDRRADADPRP